MALIIPIRGSNAYVGIAKQTVSGVAVAPSNFYWWEDGSQLTIELKEEDIREGDTTRRLSQVIKNHQLVKIKVISPVRPNTMALSEQASMGTGSDAVSAATLATTTTTSITLNSSASVTLTSVTGLGVSGTVAMVIEPGTSNEETAIFALPAVGNVLTLSATYNGGTGKFIKSHASSSAIRTPTTHVFTDQTDGDYYTLEVGLGALYGGAGMALRVRDCKVDQCKRSSKSGTLLLYETDWLGIASTSVSAATVTMDTIHNPFLFTQGVWTLDGSTTGEALNVQSFDIMQQNHVGQVQTEALTMAAGIFNAVDIDLNFQTVFTSNSRVFSTYFGSAGGTTDSQTINIGSLTLIFTQADTFNTVQYVLPTLAYIKADPPIPKANGQEYTTTVQARATSNQGANTYLMQTTVTNATTTAY